MIEAYLSFNKQTNWHLSEHKKLISIDTPKTSGITFPNSHLNRSQPTIRESPAQLVKTLSVEHYNQLFDMWLHGDRLITCGNDETVRIWNWVNGKSSISVSTMLIILRRFGGT